MNPTFAAAMLIVALSLPASVRDACAESDVIIDYPRASDVIAFWREAGPDLWFAKNPKFDEEFRNRFSILYAAARDDQLAHWLATPEGSLALILLLDQYPRNSFRGTPQMYATDAQARRAADLAIAAGHDRRIEPALRVFMYLPFAHSEDLNDQDRCVELAGRLGEPHRSRALHHRDIIQRFGRFPHRNPILGRAMTANEQKYLDDGGYRG
jgi:uncharacterized protein (DUF924 family)